MTKNLRRKTKRGRRENLCPYAKGVTGNPGGMTREEREIRTLVATGGKDVIPLMLQRVHGMAGRIADRRTPPSIRLRFVTLMLRMAHVKYREDRPEDATRYRLNLDRMTTEELRRLRHYLRKIVGTIPLDAPLP